MGNRFLGLASLYLSSIVLSACSVSWISRDVPFVTTPMEVVDRMLEMAEVKKGDIVYDLGSGNGRIVIRAAQKYGARGVGIEIDPDLVQKSRAKAQEEGVAHLVEFRAQDALTVNVSEATVVTLYLLPEFNAKLKPILQKQLKAGSRVVSHDFDIEDWSPSKTEKMPGTLLHQHTIYLWRIE